MSQLLVIGAGTIKISDRNTKMSRVCIVLTIKQAAEKRSKIDGTILVLL